MDKDYDVIVIGAGLSGLTAAYHLKKRQPNLKVVIVEASSRIGGRSLSMELNVSGGRKAVFDIGGQWVGPLQRDLLELMDEFGMSDLLFPQWVTGKKICWIDPKSIVTYNTELPFINPLTYMEAYSFMKKVDSLAEQLDTDNPYLRNPALADYLDTMTVEALIRQHIHSTELRELIRVGFRTIFGLEARQISALFAVLNAKASGSIENLISATGDGVQRWRVNGGAYQVSQRLADTVGRNNILFNAPVTFVEQTTDHVIVSLSPSEGDSLTKLKARRAILAIPPQHLLRINMIPRLPSSKIEVLRALPMGNNFKFIITYETAFWREKGLSGEIVCYGGDCGETNEDDCPVGPLSVIYDACLPDGTPALVGLSSGIQMIYWSQCSLEHRKRAILYNLAKLLGQEALSPIDYCEKNWEDEQWVGGCPGACLQPGSGRFFTSSLRLPFGKLHMAGTETAQHSVGYLSGAVQSGRRAAVEVLYSLGKHSADDAAILASTCYGPSGRALRWPVKWPTVRDSSIVTLFSSSRSWLIKLVVAVGLGFMIRRWFFYNSSFKCDRFLKSWK